MTSYRFVDRDMLMRYHWGFGVGHLYAHTPVSQQGDKSGNNTNTSGDKDGGVDMEVLPLHLHTEQCDADGNSDEPDTLNCSDSDEVCDSDLLDSESDLEGEESGDDEEYFEPATSYD